MEKIKQTLKRWWGEIKHSPPAVKIGLISVLFISLYLIFSKKSSGNTVIENPSNVDTLGKSQSYDNGTTSHNSMTTDDSYLKMQQAYEKSMADMQKQYSQLENQYNKSLDYNKPSYWNGFTYGNGNNYSLGNLGSILGMGSLSKSAEESNIVNGYLNGLGSKTTIDQGGRVLGNVLNRATGGILGMLGIDLGKTTSYMADQPVKDGFFSGMSRRDISNAILSNPYGTGKATNNDGYSNTSTPSGTSSFQGHSYGDFGGMSGSYGETHGYGGYGSGGLGGLGGSTSFGGSNNSSGSSGGSDGGGSDGSSDGGSDGGGDGE